MTKKTQAKSQANTKAKTPPHKTPEEIAQAFMHLWQEKWNETLQQKGWPVDAPTPGLGQMPFFNPFMPMNSFNAAPAGEADTIKKLEKRIADLEKRLAATAEPAKAKKTAKPKKSAKKSLKKSK